MTIRLDDVAHRQLTQLDSFDVFQERLPDPRLIRAKKRARAVPALCNGI